jgi:hypothetical protein
MPLLTDQDQLKFYDAVRAAIDISLSGGSLPDDIIKMSIYQGAAENWVLARDPNAGNYKEGGSSPDAGKYSRVMNAVIYKTASLLCPAVPAITRDGLSSDEGYTRQALDTATRAQELADLATAELSAYLVAEPTTAVLPPFMSVARGYRGR